MTMTKVQSFLKMFLIVILCFRGPCLLVLAKDLLRLIIAKDLLGLIIATDEPSRPSPKA